MGGDEHAEHGAQADHTSPDEKPVKVGQELEVLISETSRRGDGVARVEGFVVFVPAATQGEQIRIRIKSVRPNFAVGERVDAGPGVD